MPARFLAFLSFLLLLTGGCGPVNVKQLEEQKNAKQLQATDILKLVEGNTLFFHSFHEDSYYYFAPSGILFGQDIYNNKDTGKWDVADTDELCMKPNKWWYGDLRCFPVYGDGQKYFLVDDAGVLVFRADLLQGDAKNQYRELKKTAAKKSYRRSIRSQQQTPAPPADAPVESSSEQTQEQPQEEQPAEVSAIPDVPPASPGELKATVKWMAKDCPGCNLAGNNLKKADLVGAKLQGTNLADANLSMANLRRADLQGANLAGADLSYANLPGADLRGCNLKNANLKGANLIRADLTGAQVEGANFTEALLEGVQGLSR